MHIWEIKRLIAQKIVVTAAFSLHHRHQLFILHKICHFQPFAKLKISKKFSFGPLFAKTTKMSHFSALGNVRLRYVYSIVSGAKPLSLKCLMRTFIPSNFHDVTVTVGPNRHSNCCGKKHFFKPILESKFGK